MKTANLIDELRKQLEMAEKIETHPLSAAQKAERPWCDLRVGDFEIKVINREKYGLDPQ